MKHCEFKDKCSDFEEDECVFGLTCGLRERFENGVPAMKNDFEEE